MSLSVMKVQSMDTIPDNYLAILSASCRDSLKLLYAHKYDSRNPIANFRYGNSYRLVEYQFSVKKESQLMPINISYNVDLRSKTITSYFKETQGKFDLEFKTKFSLFSDSLYLNFSSIPQIKFNNDSIAFFNIPRGEFALKYQKNSEPDIYSSRVESLFSSDKESKSLLILKKNNSFYLLCMYSKSENTLPENLLFDLVNQTN